MKYAIHQTLFCFAFCTTSLAIHGPMNDEWFYDPINPYAQANQAHAQEQWAIAAQLYAEILSSEQRGTPYDQHMACINLAGCSTALGATRTCKLWKFFDDAIGINPINQLPNNLQQVTPNDSILVLSDAIGIGDRVHFFQALVELKKQTQATIIFSIPSFLIDLFTAPAQHAGIELIADTAQYPATKYTTHLMGLLGHIQIPFADFAPAISPFKANQDAIKVVEEVINPLLENKKTICLVILGDAKRKTIFIGGRRNPFPHGAHGRTLNPEALETALAENETLIFLLYDANVETITLKNPELKNRIYNLPPDHTAAFDTLVAYIHILNEHIKNNDHSLCAIVSDCGPSNIAMRAANHTSLPYITFLNPDNKQYEWRMHGAENPHPHMLAPKCLVYTCISPSIKDQSTMIAHIIRNMQKTK